MLFAPYLNNLTPVLFQPDAIPTVGSDLIILHMSALRFHVNSIPVLKDGHDKVMSLSHRTDDALTFRQNKTTNFRRSMSFANGPQLIADISRASPNVPSRRIAIDKGSQRPKQLEL